jgi:hypothetical protein
MRFAVLHCRCCLRHVWVPQDKLGLSGKCPDCGAAMQTPADWPASQLVEGPHVMHDFEENRQPLPDAGRTEPAVVGRL